MKKNILIFTLIVILHLSLSTGCGTPAGEEGAELGDRGLYNKAMEYIKEEDYKAAAKVLSTLESNFPNSVLYQQARLKKADSLFMQGYRSVYIEAIAEYKAYLALYPTAKNLDYIQKQIALSHWKRKRHYKNDQTECKKAVQEFQFFIERYPDSQYMEEVKQTLFAAYNHLAKHESYIGRFYLQIDKIKAAKARYEKALEYSKNQEDRFEYYEEIIEGLIDADQLEDVKLFYGKALEEAKKAKTKAMKDIEKMVQKYLKSHPKEPKNTQKNKK